MTTTAKQSSSASSDVRNGGSSNFAEPAEDIETIAKQISDHAEAIYQTWKARGLAPTEILNCHAETDTFNKTLSPRTSPTSTQSPRTLDADLLAKAPDLSNNNLQNLVNSFVNEDKARLAAQSSSPGASPSAIKYTLKKFENLNENQGASNVEHSPLPTLTLPLFLTAKPYTPHKDISNSPVNSSNNNNLNYLNKNHHHSNSDSPKQQQHVPDVLKDTIEKSSKRGEKPETPVKPDHLINHVPTWPLKNRNASGGAPNNNNSSNSSNSSNNINPNPSDNKNDMKNPDKKSNNNNILSNSKKSPVLADSKLSSIDVMDEVTREEEKLINALKTGTVLSNDIVPEVISDFKLPESNNSQLNGLISSMENNSELNTTTTSSNAPSQTPPPLKPNHINIYVHHKEDQHKGYTSFTRVATTRIPNRTGVQDAVFPKQGDKNNFELKNAPQPVRPFLSRGSVAERVLIFEKCPEKAPARTEATKQQPKLQIKPASKILPPLHSTLQRHLRKSTNFTIPQFYFPNGKPPPTITTETTVQRLELVFNQFEDYEIPRDKFHIVVTICQVPLYWRVPLFMCTQLTKTGCVNGNRFLDFWRQMTSFCHDAASRFIYIISRGNRSRAYILPEDMAPLIQDVVDSHPGLAFLKEAAEFHSRYVHTVIARIFYCVNRSWSGRITVTELRKSNLMEALQLLEEEEDINQIMAFFSYEHFYVIYCKFWELDRDHDLYIDQQDLARHNDHALSSRMIERIFSGCVTRGRNRQMQSGPNGSPRMSYTDFVWFLLAEEDKNHPTAIEYWFRCMDIDGDGILSMYELEYFYEEQQHRMESIGIETLPFEDCLCQMLDMIKPMKKDCVTLSDLKRCKMTPIFFDTFFNLEKYMEHEQRDPFAQKENEELSDWDRYAAQEYELLVAEEGEGTGLFDDEYDPQYENNIDLLESQIDDCVNEW